MRVLVVVAAVAWAWIVVCAAVSGVGLLSGGLMVAAAGLLVVAVVTMGDG